MTSEHDGHPTGPRPGSRGPGFEDSEGLRALLGRLHGAGAGAWRADPEAAALMRHAAGKYAALARKHGLDPWEAAAAAFDAMRNPSVRHAKDPWAVVTHAVRITCIAEERGQGLLCSTGRARRPEFSSFHDPERFSDRENPLTDYHPALQSAPSGAAAEQDAPQQDDFEGPAAGPGRTGEAVRDAAALFSLLGWPADTARHGVEYVCARLAECASRASAFESLRRDYHARALLDIPRHSWLGLLRVTLGSPDPDQARTAAGRGVLLRLLVGEPLASLLSDDQLLTQVIVSAPRRGGGRG